MRIVAFGDSYTYGHGLADCWVEASKNPGPEPSKLAWPSILAKRLNCDSVNYSRPGSSNFRILHTVLQTEFKPDDYAIIMWSFPGRDMLFKDGYIPEINASDVRIDDIGSWREDEVFVSWATAHTVTDNSIKTWYHVHHASMFLTSLGIRHYNFFVDYSQYKLFKPPYLNVPFKDINAQEFNDRALERYHPGPMTQARYAEEIRQCII